MSQHILMPAEIRKIGLQFLNVERKKISSAAANNIFKKHYGSHPSAVAIMWYDLTTTTIHGAKLKEKEKSMSGLTMLFDALYFYELTPKTVMELLPDSVFVKAMRGGGGSKRFKH